MPTPLFSVADLQTLERLRLVARQARTGHRLGERRSRNKGASLEFADYRAYVPGDDLRRLDWNLYARLEQPFIRLFEAQEDLPVHILIDTSFSMNFPDRDEEEALNKMRYAFRLATGLGYLALGAGDSVGIGLLHPGNALSQGGLWRGHASSIALMQWISQRVDPSTGTTQLNPVLQTYRQHHPRAGFYILCSDLLDPEINEATLSILQQNGSEVAIFHILSPQEIRPTTVGDWQLTDSETGQTRDVTLDAASLRAYAQHVAQWQSGLAALCAARGIHYVPVTTALPWRDLIVVELQRLGLVTG